MQNGKIWCSNELSRINHCLDAFVQILTLCNCSQKDIFATTDRIFYFYFSGALKIVVKK